LAIITIFSGSFCSGDEIASGVADRLKYDCINDKLFEETEKRFSINRDKLGGHLRGAESLFNRFTHEREKSLACLKLVLAELIVDDNVILQGCATHLLPRTIPHILRVCIIANHDYRVKQAIKSSHSDKEARRLIHNDDKNNYACTISLLDKPAYDEDLYDIVVPMHDTSVDEAVGMICDYAGKEPIRTTERSLQMAKDFVLASQVNLALTRDGHNVEVYAENDRVTLLINEYMVRLEHHQEKLAEIASKVPGVKEVTTRIGPKYEAPTINPWGNIEGPPKFLLVDDEKEFVHTLSERLQTRDLASAIAYDGEQALDMLQDQAPDVMVLDLMMPGINGIEVLRQVKKEHPDIEVIILTGHGSDRERNIADDLGAFAYLEKPVDVDHLAQVMRAAYKRVSERKSAGGPNESTGDEK
jgi:CheY-like chemotaxis protein